MPSTPSVLFATVLASLYAAVFHIFRGKTVIDLPVFWGASLLGVLAGQLAAYALKFHLLVIGEVHLLEATLLSVGLLFVVRWLKL